jgi:predicted small lipoprotein YifL
MSACVHVRVLAVGIVACVLLTGCGQSGPLTLPEETTETEVQSDENPQDDEQEEEEEQE